MGQSARRAKQGNFYAQANNVVTDAHNNPAQGRYERLTNEEYAEIYSEPMANAQHLGERRNNPLNLEDRGIDWDGRRESDGGRFVEFENPHYGIRAAIRNMNTQASRG